MDNLIGEKQFALVLNVILLSSTIFFLTGYGGYTVFSPQNEGYHPVYETWTFGQNEERTSTTAFNVNVLIINALYDEDPNDNIRFTSDHENPKNMMKAHRSFSLMKVNVSFSHEVPFIEYESSDTVVKAFVDIYLAVVDSNHDLIKVYRDKILQNTSNNNLFAETDFMFTPNVDDPKSNNMLIKNRYNYSLHRGLIMGYKYENGTKSYVSTYSYALDYNRSNLSFQYNNIRKSQTPDFTVIWTNYTGNTILSTIFILVSISSVLVTYKYYYKTE